MTPMLRAAIQQTDERASRTGERCTVYHVAHDQWGRDGVFYVRSASEGPPPGEARYDTVYVSDPGTGLAGASP